MPVVVPVKFAFAGRDLWFDPQGLDIMEGDYAICKTERGTEIGLVTADPFEVTEEELAAPLKPVLRIATDADLDRADELADRGEDSMTDFRRLVKQNDLDMKPVGVEYLFGGEKAVFYFAAEDRVDFRQLVKDLSSFFHVRVDMRQIGVRDETRLVGGFAHCGQELCCSRFGGNFEPVSIRMAKEQDLPLNSSKISGVCGRLMCCLRYEFEAYKDFKSRAPKKKTLIDTPLGKARIVEYNTPREQLVLRLENGKVFRVNLSDMSCSDENIKRSEQQGCTCRPDCVTRETLERLDSPGLQLALLELDRQNGVDVGDGLDRADRIVTSGPTPRRKRARGEDAAQAEGGSGSGTGQGRGGRRRGKDAERGDRADRGGRGGQGQNQGQGRGKGQGYGDEEAAGSGRRRRRRSAASAEAEGARRDQSRQGQGQARGGERAERAETPRDSSAGASSGSRRRRRHIEGEAAVASAGGTGSRGTAEERAGEDAAASSRSRRRKHTAAEGSAQQERGGRSGSGQQGQGAGSRSRSHKPSVPSVADQVADGEVHVSRRRPGDGGGAAPEQDEAPKKRRRRRSRKPRQDNGEAGSAPSAE